MTPSTKVVINTNCNDRHNLFKHLLSMNRSHIYGIIPSHLKSLAGKIVNKNNHLKKASKEQSLTNHIDGVIGNWKDGNVLGDMLYKHFQLLKQDFEANTINRVRYTEYLMAFKNFFELADLEKVDVPPSLNSHEILTEINKYVA